MLWEWVWHGDRNAQSVTRSGLVNGDGPVANSIIIRGVRSSFDSEGLFILHLEPGLRGKVGRAQVIDPRLVSHHVGRFSPGIDVGHVQSQSPDTTCRPLMGLLIA